MQAKDHMTLKSGSLDELANPANRVYLKIDYSGVKVHNDGNEYTLAGYLEHRGPDFVADWDKDAAAAYEVVAPTFNHSNKKGAQALFAEGDYDILGTIYLTDVDFGNGAGAVASAAVSFIGAKAGGCIISGKMVFTDKNNTEIAVLPFVEVKGLGNVSETMRLRNSYTELMNQFGKAIKKEKKKKDKQK